ncbi:MAG: AI-2E family transporter [Deltaproteobacteria bacterium]|nr:MAG: AI-2E family transporter [Deltaproteobacteria bacterium]
MEIDVALIRKTLSKDLTDIIIRLALVAVLVVMSVKVFSPFMGLMLWALVFAVTLYPLHQKLAKKLGGKPGRAATLLVLLGMLLIGAPTVVIGGAVADFVQDTRAALDSDGFAISPPPASVADLPVVGAKIHRAWTLAASDLPALLETVRPQLESFSRTALGLLTGAASGIFQFLFALIIAGIMMAFGEPGSDVMLKISRRLSGAKRGEELHKLTTATIRSVSLGVIGVAFIQSLLLGVGFVWADVPAAGILAIAVLVLGIAQVPATVLTIPVIAYLWWAGDSNLSNALFTVYFLIAGLADNVLKPVFLGRGVDAPMPVILLGALGGMVTAGMIGLFVGAVLLALAYVIFMDWVAHGEKGDGDEAPEGDQDAQDEQGAADASPATEEPA